MARNGIDRKINKALGGFTKAITGLTQACEELATERNDLRQLNVKRDDQINRIKEDQVVTQVEQDRCEGDRARLSRIIDKIQDLLN